MTSIGTLRELDAAVEEALTPEWRCEAPRLGCADRAVWLGIPACGHDLTFCERHHAHALRQLASGGRPCRTCWTLVTSAHWEPIR